MSKQPLAEVFGFPISNLSEEAEHYRANRLCPFNNKVPSCTKSSATNPIGVCSVYEGEAAVITCPIRFRERWRITADASTFFFPKNTAWTTVAEIRLEDMYRRPAGNIDLVLVAYNDQGRVIDFGTLEVQSVYISGTVSPPFKHYMEDRQGRSGMAWQRKGGPRPDYLSSSLKRLMPQMMSKGSIINHWGKKQVIAVQRSFFATLPGPMPAVALEEADLAWFIYDLAYDQQNNHYHLVLHDTVYTTFRLALSKITTWEPGPLNMFMGTLQKALDRQTGSSPDAPSLTDSVIEE